MYDSATSSKIAKMLNTGDKMMTVGTNLTFENEKVKIWELFLEPGEKVEIKS
ncbi:MAG: hypothetical protein K2Q14_06285 [Gammaproteobacteria bacterium]|nr:hypothetical protein [Gammaproteobacteria bacterium]